MRYPENDYFNPGLHYRGVYAVDCLALTRDSSGMEKHDDVIVAFGKRVRALREESDYSQERFAIEAGIDRSYYGRIERSEANPTLRQIAAIAEVLKLPIASLFEDQPKRTRRRSV